MVIQRIQTLFLLIASALCITFIFTPFGYTAIIEDGQQAILEPLYAKNIVGLLIPAAASALILLIDIFLFKNMPLQKTMAWIGFAAILATIGAVIYILVAGFNDLALNYEVAATTWGGGGLLLVAAALAVVMAVSRINLDQRLLRSANSGRIR